MSEEKTKTSKQTVKKAVAAGGVEKPKKAATPKSVASVAKAPPKATPKATTKTTAKPATQAATPVAAKPAPKPAPKPAAGVAAGVITAESPLKAVETIAKVPAHSSPNIGDKDVADTDVANKEVAPPRAVAVASAAPAPHTLHEKPAAPSAEERQRWIATAAYHRAEKRGFAPGYAIQDWLDAEAEINALIG